MFKRLITKLFLKLNPDKEIISKDDLNDLEKAKRDYIDLYKQKMYSTRKEYNVKTYVAVEFVDRNIIDLYNDKPEFEEQIKRSLASKLLDAVKENMTFKRAGVDAYGIRYEATIKIVSKTGENNND